MSAIALNVERRPESCPTFVRAPLRTVVPARPVAATSQSRHNRLLKAFPDDVWKRISAHIEFIEMPLGTAPYEVGSTIRNVYFPVNSIISLLYVMEDGATMQTAMVGLEGMIGVSRFMGCETSPVRAMVSSAGYAYMLNASVLAREFDNSPPVLRLMLRYAQSLMSQMALTAVCNHHHSLEQQFCRFLLTSLDRLSGNDLFMTHELISNIIGVRREGITEAAGKLQRLGMISHGRGRITVVDRDALEQHVCECYAVIQRDADQFLRPTNARKA